MSEMTEMEREVLEEVAGLRPPRPWGAAVGACLEFLQESGHLDSRYCITDKGREAVTPAPESSPRT